MTNDEIMLPEPTAWMYRLRHGSGLSFPKPQPHVDEWGEATEPSPLFTADQFRAAILADRERRAQAAEPKTNKELANKAKPLKASQKDVVSGIEKYLGLPLSGDAAYVKNNVISLETGSLNQQQIHAIESYGKQFGHYRVEPGGYKKISLILPKKSAAKPKPNPATDYLDKIDDAESYYEMVAQKIIDH